MEAITIVLHMCGIVWVGSRQKKTVQVARMLESQASWVCRRLMAGLKHLDFVTPQTRGIYLPPKLAVVYIIMI